MSLTNLQKAAIYLKSIDPAIAMDVLTRLDKTLVSSLSDEMTRSSDLSDAEQQAVIAEFDAVLSGAPVASTAVSSSGSAAALAAAPVIIKKEDGVTKIPSDVIKRIGVEKLIVMVKDEHPAVIGIILGALDGQVGAEILSSLTEEQQVEVVQIMAVDSVDTDIKEEVTNLFAKQLHTITKAAGAGGASKGAETTADILSYFDMKKSGAMLEKLKAQDEKVAGKIEGLMFTFENIFLKVDNDRSIQKALRNIDRKDLALAMRKVDEDTKNKVFGNMSKAAADMLQEDLSAMGPQKLAAIKDAQRKIVKIMLTLEKEGVIAFKGGQSEEEELV